ncbi:MAG: S8 family serine peptidase [Vulcanimicrobiota bacterium]
MISPLRANQVAPYARPAVARASAAEPAPAADQASLSGGSNLQSLLEATAPEAASLAGKLGPHEPGEVLVKLRGSAGLEQGGFLEDFGAKVIHQFEIPQQIFQSFDGQLVQLKLPAGMSTAQAVAAMSKDARVAYVTPNDIYQLDEGAQVTPNDLNPNLWSLNNTGQNSGTADADIDAPEAWAITTGKGAAAGGPVIAIIDSGIDYNHPDLKDNVWTNPRETADGTDTDGNGIVDDLHGYNAYAQTGDPLDGHSHGTHVSGTVAARGNNEQGVVGVNWDAQLMGVKIFSDTGNTNAAAIVRGILYATANGARITSNSWGGGAFNEAIRDAFATSPALHIMAAGNSGTDNDAAPHYPSSYDLPNILAVASTDRNDQRSSFSSYGANSVDLAAPGSDIYSTMPNGQYGVKSGTSMATPHVTGVAGLIASYYPEATNDEIKARILRGADKFPGLEGLVASGGRLNAANALDNDSLPPAAPNDFAANASGSRQVNLSWTATGDDGWCGQAAAYDVRVSDRPIVLGEASDGQVSFDEAQPVAALRPSQTGTVENVAISLVPSSSERHQFYAMRVLDNVGNASELRAAEVTVPAANLAFEDTMDGGAEKWTADAGWAQVEVAGRGKVWTDSPDGQYGNNANTSLTSQPISLAHYTGATLMFEAKHDLETRYDNLYVEASSDGQNWSRLQGFTGRSDWASHQLDLSAFDGQNLQLRFRLTSDGSVNGDGFHLDNVVIAGDYHPPQPPPQDPPQQG